jgi:hypothetical protein
VREQHGQPVLVRDAIAVEERDQLSVGLVQSEVSSGRGRDDTRCAPDARRRLHRPPRSLLGLRQAIIDHQRLLSAEYLQATGERMRPVVDGDGHRQPVAGSPAGRRPRVGQAGSDHALGQPPRAGAERRHPAGLRVAAPVRGDGHDVAPLETQPPDRARHCLPVSSVAADQQICSKRSL